MNINIIFINRHKKLNNYIIKNNQLVPSLLMPLNYKIVILEEQYLWQLENNEKLLGMFLINDLDRILQNFFYNKQTVLCNNKYNIKILLFKLMIFNKSIVNNTQIKIILLLSYISYIFLLISIIVFMYILILY